MARARRPGPRVGVLAMIVGLVSVSVTLWISTVGRLHGPILDPRLSWWMLLPLFALAELVVVQVQIRREAQTISLNELPIVLALFLATPGDMVLAAVVGSGCVYVLYRRQSPTKAMFNISLRLFGVTSTIAMMQVIAGGSAGGAGPRAWLAAIGAVSLVGAADGLLVLVVVGLHNGVVDRHSVAGELLRYPPISAVVGSVGVLAVITLHADPRAGPLLALVAVAVFWAYHTHARLNDQHVSLARLYEVGRAITGPHRLDDIAGAVLAGACDMLRADAAELVLGPRWPGEPGQRWIMKASRRAVGETAVHREDAVPADAVWQPHLGEADSLLLPKGATYPRAAAQLHRSGYREAIIARLPNDSGLTGTLLVADRQREARTFTADDVAALETVANQAALALANARLVDQLRYQATHDALTGLTNRAGFSEALDACLAELERGRGRTAAVLLLDLDGFKEVNDVLGHHAGDALLVHVGRCLTRSVGASATVARLGGDEFAVLLPALHEQVEAQVVADRIHGELQVPFPVEGRYLLARGSIGIALAPADAADGSGLLRAADTAMYRAKSQGAASPRRMSRTGMPR